MILLIYSSVFVNTHKLTAFNHLSLWMVYFVLMGLWETTHSLLWFLHYRMLPLMLLVSLWHCIVL